MERILLIGRRNADTITVRNDLIRTDLSHKVDLADRAAHAVSGLKTGMVDLVVFNMELFSKEKIKIATDMRELGYDFPVLVLAKIIAADILPRIKDMGQTVLLEKPYEKKDLKGIVTKLVTGQLVPQRIHRRFYTNQRADVKSDTLNAILETKMYNLSKGGAYFEHSGKPRMEIGDILHLDMELDKVHRRYKVASRVVWTTKEGMWTGNPGFGVEFIKPDDIYRHVLDNI
jgi:Tfp pilus assembly protein PilZ